MSLRDQKNELLDTYGLPHRLPVVFRFIVVMIAVPVILAVLWLILPHTAAVVGILVVVALLALGLGLWRVFHARELSERPGRHPMPPPSTQ
jgi:hypothetical protein